MEEAVIVSAVRTPVGKGGKGSLVNFRPESMAALCVEEAMRRAPGVKPEDVGDVIMGCAMPEGEQGMNVARMIALEAGLPDSACGMTINRYCSSGLQSISLASDRIVLGDEQVIVAGGLESMSMIPMGGNKVTPNPTLVSKRPEAYITMGLTAEKVAEKYNVTREAQDSYAYTSHMRAVKALESNRFQDELLPLRWQETRLGKNGKPEIHQRELKLDEGPRGDTTVEALRALNPVFKLNGTVTAGNSSQVSDGAAAVIVTSRSYAEAHGLKPIARLIKYAVSGVAPEIMGIGPAYAIPKVLEKAGLSMDDIDLFEINEAFASQALYCIRELGLDMDKINIHGGAIALGHPLGCTGAKLCATLLSNMQQHNVKYGVESMCIGGGMGAAALFELCD